MARGVRGKLSAHVILTVLVYIVSHNTKLSNKVKIIEFLIADSHVEHTQYKIKMNESQTNTNHI